MSREARRSGCSLASIQRVIEKLLPPGVCAVSDSPGDSVAQSFAEEDAVVASAGSKRQRDFAAGRSCARRALRRLSRVEVPILVGEHGEPLWPEGIVGSITHCPGYCAAAVAPFDSTVALGIDAERNVSLSSAVIRRICQPKEFEAVSRLAGMCSASLIFSAKESVYKAWFPLTGLQLGFSDVAITLEPVRQTFSVTIRSSLLMSAPFQGIDFEGRWMSTAEHVFTAVFAHSKSRRQLPTQDYSVKCVHQSGRNHPGD